MPERPEHEEQARGELRCPMPECGGEIRWWYRCEDCRSIIAPRVFHEDPAPPASPGPSRIEEALREARFDLDVCEGKVNEQLGLLQEAIRDNDGTKAAWCGIAIAQAFDEARAALNRSSETTSEEA